MAAQRKPVLLILFLCLLVCAAPPAGRLPETAPMTYTSSFLWSKARDLVVDGKYAYCAFLNGLVVLNLENAATPAEVSRLYLGGGFEIIKQENIVFLAAGDRGLKVVDAKNPEAPVLKGELALPGEAKGLSLLGNSVLVACGTAGLQVVDISHPVSPRVSGSIDTPGDSCGLAVRGTWAYVADGEAGIQVVDVTDPAAPKIVASLDTPGTAHKIVLSGNWAYVADGTAGLAIVSLQNSASPKLVTSFLTSSYANGLDAAGSYVYLANTYEGGFQVVDVSDPKAPASAAVLHYFMYNMAWNVVVEGSRAFLIDHFSGIFIFDLADPAKPVQKGNFPTPSAVTSLASLDDKVLAMGDLSGLQVFEMTAPKIPRRAGASSYYRGIHGVAAKGSYAFATARRALHVFDLGRLPAVRLVNSLNLPGVPRAVRVEGNYAYLTSDHSGFHVIDLTLPTAPKLVGSVEMPGFAYGLTVAGNRAFVCSSDSGFHVFDIQVPSAPRLIGSFRTEGEPYDVEVRGRYAYLADGDAGLLILDIGNPSEIAPVGALRVGEFSSAIALSGDFVYVADESFGVRKIDIRNPASPKLRAEFDTPGEPSAVVAHGDCVVVADSFSIIVLR